METVSRLLDSLEKGGALVLFYNTNTGFMETLKEFALRELPQVHYDHLHHGVADLIKNNSSFEVENQDVSFNLDYESFEDLARACWFLFGIATQDIEKVASKFLPLLKEHFEKHHKIIRPWVTSDLTGILFFSL